MDGLSTVHHPSSLLLVNSPHRNSLSSTDPTIPTKTTLLSFIPPSSLKGSVPPPSALSEIPGESALGPRSPFVPQKRKRNAEPHGANDSQLREAQERVEQKRAKIAARVPSAMAPGSARSTPATVTSLADLYAQMRRDSGMSGQQDASSGFLPSQKSASGDARLLDRRPPNATRGHSTASSPDPIAMDEDDQDIVVLKHTRPRSPQVRAHLEPVARVGPPTHLNLKSLSNTKSRTSTPTGTTVNGVDRLLDKSKSRKPKPSFAVVIPSPPKRPTYKPALHEKSTPGLDASRSQESTPAGTPVTKDIQKLKEIMNGKAPEPVATQAPPPVPVRPTQSAETIPDSLPESGSRRSRRVLGQSEAFTSRDIDILLGAVPVPFDFSAARRHPADRDNDEGSRGDGGSSLWWFHPIFEARAKADIRRTLGALLPADPAQDPLPVGADTGGWRAETRPRQSSVRVWAERLEDAFGPGPLNRGMGRKPRRVARPAGVAKRGASESWRSQNGVARGGAVVIVNAHKSPHRSIEPPSQRRSPEDTADVALRLDTDLVLAEAVDKLSISESEAAAWAAALLPLVKGKTTMDKAKMAQTNDALGEVERADHRGGFAREVLKVSVVNWARYADWNAWQESALADTVRRLGSLDSIPLGDVHGLRRRARTLADRWKEAFGDEVVDLQRTVLLH